MILSSSLSRRGLCTVVLCLMLVQTGRAVAQGGQTGPLQSLPAPSAPVRLAELRLLATGPADQSAVIKTPGSAGVAYRAGQRIAGTDALLLEVTADAAQLLLPSSLGKPTRRIWMYKATGAQPGHMDQFVSKVDPVEVRTAPTIQVLSLSSGQGTASSIKDVGK